MSHYDRYFTGNTADASKSKPLWEQRELDMRRQQFAMMDDVDTDNLILVDYPAAAARNSQDMTPNPPPQDRYVAEEVFFVHVNLGSLRNGLPQVKLFDPQYIGLPIFIFCGGFAVAFSAYVFLPILQAKIPWTPNHVAAASGLMLVFPNAISVVFGIISDKVPIMGLRRKPYMFIGTFIAALAYLIIFIMYCTSSTFHALTYVLLSAVAYSGVQLGVSTCMATINEFSQREYLSERGTYQAELWGMFVLGGSFGAMFVPLCLSYGAFTYVLESAAIGIPLASAILAVVSAIPLPFLIHNLREEKAIPTHRDTFANGFVELWEMMKLKVFAWILLGLCGIAFFLKCYSMPIQTARMVWCGIDGTMSNWIGLVTVVSETIAVVIYWFALVNVNWRIIAGVGGGLFIVSQLAVIIPTSLEATSVQLYWYIWYAIGSLLQGWLTLLVPIVATEVTSPGQEGAVSGLIQSFVILFSMGSSGIWSWFASLVETPVTTLDIVTDTPGTRLRILREALLWTVVSILGILSVFFLPQQKIDAQQRRMFAGFSKSFRIILTLIFVGLFVYDFSIYIKLL